MGVWVGGGRGGGRDYGRESGDGEICCAGCLDGFFLGEHAVEEGVGVHLDFFVDGGGAVVGGEVAEGFEESELH